MTQSLDLTIASTATGTTQRVELNDIIQALTTFHSGATRPAYLPSKAMWFKVLSGTLNALYFYDGTTDVLMGNFDSSNLTFTPSGQLSGFANSSSNKTANYTLIDSDYGKLVTLDTTTSAFTLSVQSWATLSPGWFCILQKVDATSNLVIVDPNGTETINGSTAYSLTGLNNAIILIRLATTNTFSALVLPNTELYATINSPTFTGNPSAPTATLGTSTTQIATTAFLRANRGPVIIRRQIFTTTNTTLTYTPNANMLYCKVEIQGAGGNGSANTGGIAGGSSYFRLGTTIDLLTAIGGGSTSTLSTGGPGGIAFDDGSGGAFIRTGQDGEHGGSGRSGKGGNSFFGFGGRAQIITASGGLTAQPGRSYGAGGSGEGGNTGGSVFGGGGGGGYICKIFTKDQIASGGTKTFFIGAAATGSLRIGSQGIGIVTEYCTI